MKNYKPIYHKSAKGILHGGDYNPDQWLRYPEIINEDFDLMQKANCQTFTIGMFSWSQLEPEEGVYHLEWLDSIIKRIGDMEGSVILATPSGARPAWLSRKYPEVLRTDAHRQKQLHGLRHNHCFTSPVYREKTQEFNRLLANRYKDNPTVIMWHISNEYSGECHCDLCQEAFRSWLQKKYQTLEELNHAWWTNFWSHQYSDWSEIESPSPIGEHMVHGMNIDWKRFVTDQTISFYENETVPFRELTPDIPITTNFMSRNPEMLPFHALDYDKFAKHVDVISWDSYPCWHHPAFTMDELASRVSFENDYFRSLKNGQSFMIMEMTPSLVNWVPYNKMKKKNVHELSALQNVADGSDSILYFQWRQSRGSSEKFHGAVVDHTGTDQTRVFQEVAALGGRLNNLSEVPGARTNTEVAIVYDVENDWLIEDAQALANETKKYPETVMAHYEAFWKRNIPTDVISLNHDLKQYKLIVAPMLYKITEEHAKKLETFVEHGGTLVTTYFSGRVNENDLTYLGGFPGPLRSLLGIWAEEIDTLYPTEESVFKYKDVPFKVHDYIETIHPETADVLAMYEEERTPVITKNQYGTGAAFYLSGRTDRTFHEHFYKEVVKDLQIKSDLPELVMNDGHFIRIRHRKNERTVFYFLQNFSNERKSGYLTMPLTDAETDEEIVGEICFKPFETRILKVNME
ncbi:Beta-galactosidase GanA [Paraliobacillus sp. PM-2]|uniref:beta-galactosidase n=1 Tax=Paraliobacillus sp. PM-2 TaxID=1462524 RepID=UPI00061C4FC9|nr:beta-galactosidase [Paraliobacillus sp. PM-2]CQR46461.1 Beta-galactosidase GanA [Paraliobacillus sp. PM-2]